MSVLTGRLTKAALVLNLVFSLAAGVPTRGDEPLGKEAAATVRLQVPPSELRELREDWYGIYSGDSKLGYMRTTVRPGETIVEVENEMHLKVVTLGEKREVRTLESLEFAAAAPYRLLKGTSTVEQGPFVQKVMIEPTQGGFNARITAAGSERTMKLEPLDFTLADVLTPELWFRQPRVVGDTLAARSFSVSDLRSSVDTYTVLGLSETHVDGVAVAYYEVDLHSSMEGDVGTALIDTRGRLVSGILGGAFELRRESAELARDFDYAADVYLLGLAEIDRGLGDPREVSGLVLEFKGSDLPEIPSSSRQSLAFDEDTSSWRLTIGDGVGVPRAATNDEIEQALEETVEHPIREPEIVELAHKATDGAFSQTAQVRQLVHFVDRFLLDSYSAEPLTVLDMLSTPEGDCTEHALLFTTLARSLGIPTREVTGLLYLGDDVQAFGGHAWNEVVLDGHWIPVDATWGETEINATHIRLGTRLGKDASLQSLFAGYSFKVVEISRY